MKIKNHIIASFLLLGSLMLGFSNVTYSKTNVINNNQVKNSIKIDNPKTNIYNPSFNLKSSFFISSEINDIETLKKYSEEEKKPNSIIIYIDKDLNICNKDMRSLNISFKDCYDIYIKTKMLPCIYLANDEISDNFLNYIDNVYCPLDIAVIGKAEYIKKVRSTGNGLRIRGIVDYSDRTIDFEENDLKEAIKEVNMAYSNTVLLSEACSSRNTINFFESRFKTVRVKEKEFLTLNTISLVSKGVYSIVTSNVKDTFEAVSKFSNSQNKNKNVNRNPYNIAHRGLPYDTYENSLEGFIKSFEEGATHIEIDVQITKDNQLVIMHDNSINRVCGLADSPTLNVIDLTLEEIKTHKIIKNYYGQTLGEGVEIPTLDDVMKTFKGNGKIIVLEIKLDTDTTDNFVKLFKEKLEEYDMYDQFVCISFNETQLQLMKQNIPEIPCATLNTKYNNKMFYTTTGEGIVPLNRNNFGADFNYGSQYSSLFDLELASRGYAGWYWTLEEPINILSALNDGILGITNNRCNVMKDIPIELVTSASEIKANSEDYYDCNLSVTYKTYGGYNEDIKLDATPMYVEDKGEYGIGIFSATFSKKISGSTYKAVYFTDPIKILKGDKKGDDNQNNNKRLIPVIVIVGSLLIISTVLVPLIINNKRKVEKR